MDIQGHEMPGVSMRNPLHALAPYFAMFPESFAEKWIERFSRPGDVVLDPFCGRGTTPFQASLMGRIGVGNDLNDVAVCLTNAKLNHPSLEHVQSRLTELFEMPDRNQVETSDLPPFFHYAYRDDVLKDLVFLRHTLDWKSRSDDCFIAALVLGDLHGESHRSSRYLSARMPRTISTKPAYSIRYWIERGIEPPERDTRTLLEKMARLRLRALTQQSPGYVIHQDARRIHESWHCASPAKLVVTSPPYFDTTRFEEDQWLRLWFLGGSSKPTYGKVSRDDRHSKKESYYDFLESVFISLRKVISDSGKVVVRIGGRKISLGELRDLSVTSAETAGLRCQSASLDSIVFRQTGSFNPNTIGCKVELDLVFEAK